jgi:hypothetical protein
VFLRAPPRVRSALNLRCRLPFEEEIFVLRCHLRPVDAQPVPVVTQASKRHARALQCYDVATFMRHFTLKTIVLPRQTRDKHRKDFLKEWRFLASMLQREET